jgi:signal transduction histidine kinase
MHIKYMQIKNQNLIDKIIKDKNDTRIEDEKLKEIEKLAQFGQLSGGLIHDLISPITSLNLQIDMLDDKMITNADFINSIKSAIKNINRYAELIKSYVGGKNENKIIILDEEIQKAIELISYKAIKKSIEIQFIREKNIFISTDPVLIYQIVISLVSNAIESFREIDEKRLIIIKLESTYKNIILTINDFGEGIAEVNKIFNPFYTTKRHLGGTGIGLSSVKHIVQQEFNGKIIVKSKINEGSEFKIYIRKNII